MSHYERRMDYLNKNRIIYKKYPSKDKPTEVYDWGYFYEYGTHECYELFRSKAKITTYKSLKWHLLVLWYLNPGMSQDKFVQLARTIVKKENGFVAFNISDQTLNQIVHDVSMADLEEPPKNKARKVIFKDFSGLSTSEKLSIVGTLIGRNKKATAEDIYDTMLYIHDIGKKITIKRIAEYLKVSTRTVYRNITNGLKREKELLNNEL
jgi:hypothetical protein